MPLSLIWIILFEDVIDSAPNSLSHHQSAIFDKFHTLYSRFPIPFSSCRITPSVSDRCHLHWTAERHSPVGSQKYDHFICVGVYLNSIGLRIHGINNFATLHLKLQRDGHLIFNLHVHVSIPTVQCLNFLNEIPKWFLLSSVLYGLGVLCETFD